jgi:subtilisin-like proprotein convertase family protein
MLTNDFSVMAWVNPDSVLFRQRIIGSSGLVAGGWGFGIDYGISGSGLVLTGYGVEDVATPTVNGVQAGVWQHVAATKSSVDGTKFYHNGDSLFVDPSKKDDWTSTTSPYALMGSGGERLSGAVDEVRVYQGVLSQQQVRDAASGLLCSAPNLALLDHGEFGGSVSDDLTVADDDLISDLNVTLDISHTNVSDLRIILQHVDTGTEITLLDQFENCTYPDILATFDDSGSSPQCQTSSPAISGTLQPQDPLSAFDGERLGGTWRLHVDDLFQPDTGTLNRWCLQAQKSTFPDEIDANGFEP